MLANRLIGSETPSPSRKTFSKNDKEERKGTIVPIKSSKFRTISIVKTQLNDHAVWKKPNKSKTSKIIAFTGTMKKGVTRYSEEKSSKEPRQAFQPSQKKRSSIFSPRKLCSEGRKINEKNYLWIVFFVKKFVQILKYKTIQSKLKKMHSYQENILCDLSFFKSEDGKRDKTTLNNPIYRIHRDKIAEIINKISSELSVLVRKLKEFSSSVSKLIPLFEMDSIYSMLWNSILMIFLAFNFLVVPIHVSFGLEKQDYYPALYFCLQELPLYLSCLDILHSLNKAYYSKGVYVKQRRKIIRFYFKWNFWLDVFVILPMVFVESEFNSHNIVHMSFLIIAIKLQNLNSKLEDYLQFKEKFQGFINLLQLMFKVLSIANLTGCAWNAISQWEVKLGINNTWMNYLHVDQADWKVRYISSLYFSIVTMVTVGYGDISPQNSVEKSFAIIIITLSCGFFAYALNSVGIILKEMYREDDEFKVKIYSISSYMKEKKMSHSLQMKVKKYLEYMFHDNQEHKRSMLFDSLSNKLREEVQIDIYGKILKNCKFFKNNFSEKFLHELSLKFNELTLAPEEIIYSRNQISEKGVYFIIKGNVEYFITRQIGDVNHEISLRILEKGDSFGEDTFLHPQEPEFSVRTKTVAQIAFLSLEDFETVIQNFPIDYEIYRQIRDQYEVYNEINLLEKRCNSCGNSDHFVINCPLLNYRINREIIIKNYVKKKNDQTRATTQRQNILEEIETKQEELGSLYDIFGDTSSPGNSASLKTLTEMRVKDLTVPIGNSLLTMEESMKNLQRLPEDKRLLQVQQTRLNPIMEQSGESLLSSKRIDEGDGDQNKQEKSGEYPKINEISAKNEKPEKEKITSMKSFRASNFLELRINDFCDGRSVATSQRLSGITHLNDDKIIDLHELAINFERMKNFKVYFPHNNAEVVVKKIQMINAQSMKLKKKVLKKRRNCKDSLFYSSTGIALSRKESKIKFQNQSFQSTEEIPLGMKVPIKILGEDSKK